MRAIETLQPTVRSLTVVTWPEHANGRLTGEHDPRSRYVELYWLGILGPSTTWLLRHLADELEASPTGFVMHLDDVACRLGVAGLGRHSPFTRAMGRLQQFGMAQLQPDGVLAVRKTVPSLSPRHLVRLPEQLRRQHDYWVQQQQSPTTY